MKGFGREIARETTKTPGPADYYSVGSRSLIICFPFRLCAGARGFWPRPRSRDAPRRLPDRSHGLLQRNAGEGRRHSPGALDFVGACMHHGNRGVHPTHTDLAMSPYRLLSQSNSLFSIFFLSKDVNEINVTYLLPPSYKPGRAFNTAEHLHFRPDTYIRVRAAGWPAGFRDTGQRRASQPLIDGFSRQVG